MIIVDVHEPDEIIHEIRRYGAPVKKQMLTVADYVIRDVGIERKTVNDLYKSILDGRLYSQLDRLSKAYSRRILLIEGDLNELMSSLDNPNVVLGSLVSIALRNDVGVVLSRNYSDTGYILYNIWVKRMTHTEKTIVRHLPPKLSLKDRILYILMGFPGVGYKLAENIMMHYGTLKNFCNTTQSELESIEGVGEKKAWEIIKILNTDYRKLKLHSES